MSSQEPDAASAAFFIRAVQALKDGGVDFLVGGAYALARHSGIERHTKDFDVFVRPRDLERALEALKPVCDRTELTFPHWLAKAHCDDAYVDVIFSSGNGLCEVDDEWFDHSIDSTVLGQKVRLVPPEEIIWQKAFIMERERYDGADILHILRTSGDGLDWTRLLRRFREHWRVLFSHLVLFGFVYPCERQRIPEGVLRLLCDRLMREQGRAVNGRQVCQGTLISREQYLVDLERWDYQDARLLPPAQMTEDEIAEWTAAIAAKE